MKFTKTEYFLLIIAIVLLPNVLTADEKEEKPPEMYSFPFKKVEGKDLPDGFRFKAPPENGKTVLLPVKDEKGSYNILKIELLKKKSSVYITSSERILLNENKNYVFMIHVKIDNIRTDNRQQSGMIIYVYGGKKHYTSIRITGNGSTDGWLTAYIPFSTSEDQLLMSPYLMLRCLNMKGTVCFKLAGIIEERNTEGYSQRFFVNKKGKRINKGLIRLNNVKEKDLNKK